MKTRSVPFVAAGLAAGSLTLGVAELLAAAWTVMWHSTGTPSPLLAAGGAFVDVTPAWLKDWAVAVFGTADKVALGVGMALVLVLVCSCVGLLLRVSRAAAVACFVAVGCVGGTAVWTRPFGHVLDVAPTVAGVAAGVQVLTWLAGRWGAPPETPTTQEPVTALATRRDLLRVGGGLTALGVLGVAAGQAMSGARRAATAAAAAIHLPLPRRRVTVPAAATSDITGHTSFITPAADFYRIDTALRVPNVDVDQWRLKVTGLVDTPLELTFADLLRENHVEAMVTLTCVSNEVGGDLVGNAVWLGWPVREVLARAGVRAGADMVLSRSVDGFTAGTPIEALTDDRDALLAVAMNGAPLPAEHGFPVRLVVPGLYGYVSATKWVTELKVTRFDADQGYWTPRGWSERGPIKTASRIDVPRDGASVAAGDVVVAGVAWAQHRGVTAVHVQVDDGPWQDTELRAEPTIDTWRLWAWTWAGATPGEHTLRVRATDASGETQTAQVAPPAPDGATGWHTITVRVH